MNGVLPFESVKCMTMWPLGNNSDHLPKMKTIRLSLKQTVMTLLIALATLITCFGSTSAGQPYPAPYLRKQGMATQLVVDDQPFLVLAGEVGNSTSASLDYMRPIWPRLTSLNLNTVLIPVYWELIE